MASTSGYNSSNEDLVFYSGNNTIPTAAPEDGIDTTVLLNGDRYEWDGTAWQQVLGSTPCPDPMTRAALIALRNAGSLNKDCHYVITNPSADGTLDVQEIILHAVNENTLSQQAGIMTSHDNTAWQGVYDIDQDNVLEVTDNLENKVISNTSILVFPFGVTSVTHNVVHSEALINYTAGTVTSNTFGNNSNTTIGGGTFTQNVIESDANVNSSGTSVVRNHFEASSNTTITSGDFVENRVESDATVNSSTTGDVDNNHFSSLSITSVSGAANVDTVTIKQNANLTISGGSLSDTSIQEDAQVILISGSHYENVFGASTIFTQIGTGYIRYSTIEGTTTWTNGDVNISNVNSYVSTVDTTGSAGAISNSTFSRAYMQNLQNIPSLTITDSTVTDYGTVQTNGATRIYLYRSHIKSGGRVLVSANSRIDASYTTVSDYGYLQSTANGGFLTANYCDVSSYGYIRNTTVNTHIAERCHVSSQSNIRFDGTANNCRVYYSNATGGGSIYHSGSSNASYIYYANADSLGQIYTQNSTDARMYYCSATSYGYVRSLNCTSGTHYMYYCNGTARGYVQMNNAGGRMYAVNASSQSIVEKRGAGGNIYYSNFDAYFYAYITRTTGTSSGLFGMGRRTQTVTTPTTVAPFNVGSAWLNFQ